MEVWQSVFLWCRIESFHQSSAKCYILNAQNCDIRSGILRFAGTNLFCTTPKLLRKQSVWPAEILWSMAFTFRAMHWCVIQRTDISSQDHKLRLKINHQ
jgi:hypothetical protein